MFGLSKKEKIPQSPIPDQRREWIEQTFAWLVDTFGEEAVRMRRVLVPHHSDFPIRYNGDPQTGQDTLAIVAPQMELDPECIELTFYQEGARKISTGSFLGTNELYMESGQLSSGQYLGKTENGKHHIALEARRLNQPEQMVSSLANELARIKLLGEEKGKESDERLTGLATVIFGLGIFNANAAQATFQNLQTAGKPNSDYLTQMDWGYALALFAKLRNEKDPKWATYLTTNIRADFSKSAQYLISAK